MSTENAVGGIAAWDESDYTEEENWKGREEWNTGTKGERWSLEGKCWECRAS